MTRKKLARLAPIQQEVPERAPRDWAEVQQIGRRRFRARSVAGGRLPASRACRFEQQLDCEALQSSPEHVTLRSFCGLAHKRATVEGAVFTIDATRDCSAFLPVEINKRQLAVMIGGRAIQ